MPRASRKVSETKIYHVMLRGNERKKVFQDDEDKRFFTHLLYEKKKNNAYGLFAYCILDNHTHLVIKEIGDPIARVMKRIATSYAYYYNKKHKRVGHVFQDRFKSEVVNNEGYLLAVIRYVHNNPEKACIAAADAYLWSSMRDYLTGNARALVYPEAEEILKIFSHRSHTAIRLFREYGLRQDEESFMDLEERIESEIDEDNAGIFVMEWLRNAGITPADLQKKGRNAYRSKLIHTLAAGSSLSARAIANMIGISRETVRKEMLSAEPSP